VLWHPNNKNVAATLRGTAVRQNAWAPGLGTSRRIHNGATSTGTERFAKRILAKGSINHEFNETSHGWKISSIGFGGYRVREKVPQHKAAMYAFTVITCRQLGVQKLNRKFLLFELFCVLQHESD
jgi:hypothetical protein